VPPLPDVPGHLVALELAERIKEREWEIAMLRALLTNANEENERLKEIVNGDHADLNPDRQQPAVERPGGAEPAG
jgi:hypothetical protein